VGRYYKTILVSEVLDWLKSYAAPIMLQVLCSMRHVWPVITLPQQPQSLSLSVTVHAALLRSIALLLAQKLMDVGFFRMVWGDSKAPLQQLDGLLRFHDDERDISMLNCR
jgi:hypothetical protein